MLGLCYMALAASLVLAACRDVSGPDPTQDCQEQNPVGSLSHDPAWSPSGEQVAFIAARSPDGVLAPGIYVKSTTTGELRRIFHPAGFLGMPIALEWCPTDEDLLLFSFGTSIGIFSIRDSVLQPVRDPEPARWIQWAVWSPEGDSLCYLRGLLTQNEPLIAGGIHVMDLNGTTHRPLAPAGGFAVYPRDPVSFAPDGNWLAYAYVEVDSVGFPTGSDYDLYLIRRDGTQRRRLTFLNGDARNPRWARGGSEIVFDWISHDCRNNSISPLRHTWSVRPDGTGLHRWMRDLGDSRVQFGFPPAFDRTGYRVATTQLNPGGCYGVLWLGDLGTGAREVFYDPPRPGSPCTPRPPRWPWAP